MTIQSLRARNRRPTWIPQAMTARPPPSRAQRNSAATAAMPAYAPSTCSHNPSRAQTSAMAGTGSTLVVEVVPTVATTQNGRQPGRRGSALARARRAGGEAAGGGGGGRVHDDSKRRRQADQLP